MSYESAVIPAPYNGISQSAPQVRLAEQAQDLLDCLVDLPDGWRKRPPLTWVGKLVSSGGTNDARIHKTMDPDDNSLHFILVNREAGVSVVRLYDALMSTVAVSVSSDAQTYLNGATTLKTDLRMSQAVDYTVFTDRTALVGVDASLVATRPYEGIVFIKSGAFGKKYEVTITKSGGTPRVGYVLTPNGDNAEDSLWTGTDKIAAGIFQNSYAYAGTNSSAFASIQANLTTDGFTTAVQGGVIYISHASTDFTIAVRDDQGGTAMVAAKGTINNFSDLPKTVPTDGFTVEVLPTRGDKDGAYWVQFNLLPSPGSWAECVAPGSQKGFDLTTMPVGLIKGGGGWALDVLDWKQRGVGDQTLAIDPLFVGDYIQDVGYAFGRLCIVSAEETFLTAADDPFRIYPATLTTQIDSDPISLSPPDGKGAFQAITTFGTDVTEGVLITGLVQQCVLRSPGDGPVTPKAVKLKRLSKYELDASQTVFRPLVNNSKAYLPVPLDQYIGIREMQVDRISGEVLGDDLTAATPELLPLGIDVGATIESNYTALYGVSGTNQLYFHVFRYSQNQRVQNGFFPWHLPSGWTLVDISSHGTIYYIFALNGGAIHCFTIQMNPKSKDTNTGATVLTRWDLKQSQAQVVSSTYNSTADTTTIVSQVPLQSGFGYVSAAANPSAQAYPEGYLAEVVSQPTSTSITIKGDWTAGQAFYLGVAYTGYWKLSRIFQTSLKGDQRVVHSGDLTLSRLVFDLSEATSLTINVTNGGRSTRSTNLKQNIFGSPTFYTGKLTVPLKGKAEFCTIEVLDQSHIGATSSGFEWFGQFVSKSNRQT